MVGIIRKAMEWVLLTLLETAINPTVEDKNSAIKPEKPEKTKVKMHKNASTPLFNKLYFI